MAASLPFSALSLPTTKKFRYSLITTTARAELPLSTSSTKSRPWSEHKEHKGTLCPSIHSKKNLRKLCCNKQPVELGSSETETDSDLFHASNIVEQLYSSINDKKLDKIHELIAEKCFFEELSFPNPFQKKEEVIYFFKELAVAMGKDVKFKPEMIYKGGEHAAGVTWHLEWKGKEIPFTKGCSFYECKNEGERLVITRARIVIEAPLKPGVLVLKLLRTITYLFDQFPQLTERFLVHHRMIFNMLSRIYKMFIEPIIQPIWSYYTHLWRFTTLLLSCLVKIIQPIINLFIR
ncbi:hypothetical protein MRB53_003366 [Persea americana]|uniref:Uncharacterized protein n=1 Tax=Persea americana TaxID=3435 RepID=A0ACC2MXU8_PERAE|nr:hypothetical protein MRB53_003366 [Persea americana]